VTLIQKLTLKRISDANEFNNMYVFSMLFGSIPTRASYFESIQSDAHDAALASSCVYNLE
jgi:hypothetical protein